MAAYLRKQSPVLLVLLSGFVALSPLSTDMYLPAFPGMVEAFDTQKTMVQLTLSAYLAGFCVFHLVCGPLSDRFGRKPVLLVGLSVFLLASIACSLVVDIEQLIFWRFIQGVGVCTGPTVARAMVRDIYSLAESAKALASMAAIMALVPVVAPIVGGWLLNFWAWPALFIVMALYALICLLLLCWRVPESLVEKQSIALSYVFRNYWQLLKHKQYLLNVLTASCLYAGTFAFVASSSFILIDFMGVAADHFGYWFVLIVLGYIAGNVFTARLGHKISRRQQLLTGVSMAVLSSSLMVLLCHLKMYHPLMVILPAAFYMGSAGIVFPQTMAGAMAPFAKIAGTASALMGFLQMALAALATVVTSMVLTADPMPLALTLSGCSLLAAVLIVLLLKEA